MAALSKSLLDAKKDKLPAQAAEGAHVHSSGAAQVEGDELWDKLPRTPADILRHAIKGAIRAFTLAYGARVTLAFLLRLLAVLRKKDTILGALLAAVRSQDGPRFGAFFGLFAFGWKLVSHSLREIRGIDDRWNDFVGGCVGGLAILAETPERRVSYMQQMSVRALQAIYASLHSRNLVSIPHGGAWLFALTGSQVMYAYMMRPETLPSDFYRFMVGAARVPDPILRYNCTNVRQGQVDPSIAVDLVRRYKGTADNLARAQGMSATPGVIPCAVIHPTSDSCAETNLSRWLRVFQMIAPVYASLNIVPMLTLRLKHFLTAPRTLASKAIFNTVRSSSFLASYVTIFQLCVCLHRNLHGWVERVFGRRMADSRALVFLFGFLNSAAILIEHPSRRVELGLYVLPKAVDSLFRIMVQRRLAVVIPHAEVAMFAAAMGAIMSFYQREPECMTPMMRKLMRPFFGRY
ncbi:hypothetical protein THASP1DRAFT_30768 [Thamnocephalis sphaerospora]|uniref:Transmembrane protein 135 N-terminal domain-containing protein n=1 Tax=Thamnocephalis sphaerospora TaxID=78915 RepID=A0A4P9XNA6_9FUNG|nr:hypothetical protein THASP1DRAFT_30768 [Thamnocephalis sphaerospora]|eukprot:RKP07418.1 hypothetical protein THASP1DRAFT_30768 [Thamnocephalis sphaerospora]